MVEIDPYTLRVVAGLIRSRMSRLDMDTRMDGLQRLGAARALKQLAVDLEISADHVSKPVRARKRSF
jgi:hypothetical protein